MERAGIERMTRSGNFFFLLECSFKRRSVLRPGPLFKFPLRMKSNVVRAYFAQLHHPTRYGWSICTLDRRATRCFTIFTFFIKNILWSWPRRIRCPDVSRWTKTVEKTMFGAVLEKNIRHAYRRPQTRKIEPSTTVNGCFVPIVFFQTCLNVLKFKFNHVWKNTIGTKHPLTVVESSIFRVWGRR